jgi:assimilatory nitrate reductase catalytic subunit
MHPLDAQALDLQEYDLVSVTARQNKGQVFDLCLPVVLSAAQRRGELFAPIHWSAANASSANIGTVYTDANDKLSGQPELKHAAVAINKVSYALHGQLYVRQAMPVEVLASLFEYFVCTAIEQGQHIVFATDQDESSVLSAVQQSLPHYQQWVSGQKRILSSAYALAQGRLTLLLFISPQAIPIDPNWVNTLLVKDSLEPQDTHHLLNMPSAGWGTHSKLICSCFKISQASIITAIEQGCNTVDNLGVMLKCGTNCGSCKSELSQLLAQHLRPVTIDLLQQKPTAGELLSGQTST